MKLLLLFLLTASAFAQQAPAKITREDIVATVKHMRAIVSEQGAELDAAKGDNATLRTQIADANGQLVAAQGESAVLQRTIDEKEAQRLEEQRLKQEALAKVEKLEEDKKRLSRIASIIAGIAATFAAFYVFEMLKPAGLLGKFFTVTNLWSYGIPVLVWISVYGSAWVYLTKFL